jgi:hypothetical protein
MVRLPSEAVLTIQAEIKSGKEIENANDEEKCVSHGISDPSGDGGAAAVGIIAKRQSKRPILGGKHGGEN